MSADIWDVGKQLIHATTARISETKKKYRFGAFKVGMLPSCKNITPKHQIGYSRLLAVKGRMEKKSERPVKKEAPPTAALRYGFLY